MHPPMWPMGPMGPMLPPMMWPQAMWWMQHGFPRMQPDEEEEEEKDEEQVDADNQEKGEGGEHKAVDKEQVEADNEEEQVEADKELADAGEHKADKKDQRIRVPSSKALAMAAKRKVVAVKEEPKEVPIKQEPKEEPKEEVHLVDSSEDEEKPPEIPATFSRGDQNCGKNNVGSQTPDGSRVRIRRRAARTTR